MAKFLCCYSGLEITTSHFPLYLSSRHAHTACHPIFHADQKTLFSYARKWSAGELTQEDSFLLYVALLKSSDLVHFRVPACFVSQGTVVSPTNGATHTVLGSTHIIAHSMEKLLISLARINAIANPSIRFPEVVITHENSNLHTSKHWVDNWNQIWIDYQDGSKRQELRAKLAIREAALQRLIKSPHRRLESYSSALANWANDAAAFPIFLTTIPDGRTIPLADYWKEIIQHAATKEYFKISLDDLKELMGFLSDRIEFSIESGENSGGSIQSYLLFRILEDARKHFRKFISTSLNSEPIKTRIARTWAFPGETKNLDGTAMEDEESEVEEFLPGLNALVAAVPIEKPLPQNFPTKLEYIKAKIKWEVAESERRKSGIGNTSAVPGSDALNALGF